MLDVMKRKKGITRIIVVPVIIGVAGTFGFALYGVWGGGYTKAEQGAANWIAVVDGEQIPAQPFRQRQNNILQDLRNQFGAQGIDEKTLSNLAQQQALGSLMGTYLARQAAEREGLRVTPEEIRSTILSLPVFQSNGKFIGLESYQNFLRAQGLTAGEFESQVAQDLAADKIRGAVSRLAQVTDSELEQRYLDEVERVDVDYLLLPDSEYTTTRPPSESSIKQYFEDHSTDYMTRETRRASYVLFDREARSATVTVPEAELKDAYEKNKTTLYSHAEERRASHILFGIGGDGASATADEARAKAQDVLDKLRAGEDFATLARLHSEDESSAPAGGDLGYFGRGRMVREFEDAAFSMKPGDLSEIIESGFGMHIIKLTEERPAGVQPFDEVREEINRGLAVQKAQTAIRTDADAFTTRLAAQESSFESIAAGLNMTIQDTDFFGKGEPLGSLGRVPQADDAIFTLASGDTSPVVAVPQGLAIFKLTEARPPAPSPLAEVRQQVVDDLNKFQARAKARQEASRILAASGSLADRAAGKKLEVKNYPAVSRVQPLPPLNDASKSAAFAADLGAVLGPYEADDGLLIIELKGKFPATPDEENQQRKILRTRLHQEARDALYQALMAKLQKSAEIQVNDGLLQASR